MNCLTLYELNTQVRSVLEKNFSEPVWIQAELSSVATRGGHCFLEFVQKSSVGNTFIAKARGQIWNRTWTYMRPYFEKATGLPLSVGMQVMVQVEVTFHEQYGYSLNVTDINPTFTLGDIARRRREILQRLEEEGVINLNKELSLPPLLQRIAVISSEGAAGWGDFLNQLQNNEYGLAYKIRLFPAVMQGEKVEQSIISALDRIAAEQDQWDLVVIVRGGGATSDLTGFDTLRFAENVANFPLPILTGIGHERDDTVIDIISHTRVKTPTAAADFIVHKGVEQLTLIDSIINKITDNTQKILHAEKRRIESLAERMKPLVELFKTNQLHKLQNIMTTMQNNVNTTLESNRHRLKIIETQLDSANPSNLMRLGFSITRHNGKAVRDKSILQPSDEIETTLFNGTIISTINK